MSKSTAVRREKSPPGDSDLLGEWQRGMLSWAGAVQAHKMAPPDRGFALRLAALAQGASEAARVCRLAAAAGFEWPPARKADSEPPYELRPETGRRGPQALWRRFDQAVTHLRAMAAGSEMLEVAGAFEEIAAIAGELAQAVEAEDRPTARARARRAARPRASRTRA
jgi:hypothetical protein